jgi:2-polyprenyl-3-methyl-5-hydroxy-6-metoxy-1,4-benzoquinol methylase
VAKKTIETGGCNLCGSRNADLIADSLRFGVKKNVARCQSCHLVYLYPLMTEQEEKILYEEEYRNIADVEGHYLPQKAREFYEIELNANKERLRRVVKFLGPQAKILEIGCAAGSFLNQAKDTGAECTGVELHKAFAAFVRTELGIKTYDIPLEECGFAPESFDAIFLFHVLEHIRQPGEYLLLLHQLLKKGGRVFIELPNVDDALVSVYKLKKYRAFYYQPAHSYYFSHRTLSRMLKKVGFQTKTIMLQRYSLLNHLNWIFRGRPQAKPSFNIGFPLSLLDWPYRSLLKLTGKADTLFMIGQKEK